MTDVKVSVSIKPRQWFITCIESTKTFSLRSFAPWEINSRRAYWEEIRSPKHVYAKTFGVERPGLIYRFVSWKEPQVLSDQGPSCDVHSRCLDVMHLSESFIQSDLCIQSTFDQYACGDWTHDLCVASDAMLCQLMYRNMILRFRKRSKVKLQNNCAS